MGLRLKFLNGPQKGKELHISPGDTLGRADSNAISINDPKMSARHIRFEADGTAWKIFDAGSKNGFRVNGNKFTVYEVKSNAYLRVGGSEFELLVSAPLPAEAPPQLKPKATPPTIEKLSWPEYFSQFIQLSAEKVRSKPKTLIPFSRAVQLKILNGLQAEQTWTLGYGPRDIGPHSHDLVIEDPGAPPICFRLVEDSKNVIFSTERPDVVRVNNSSLKTEVLKDGDLISFASTTIQFSFIESSTQES